MLQCILPPPHPKSKAFNFLILSNFILFLINLSFNSLTRFLIVVIITKIRKQFSIMFCCKFLDSNTSYVMFASYFTCFFKILFIVSYIFIYQLNAFFNLMVKSLVERFFGFNKIVSILLKRSKKNKCFYKIGVVIFFYLTFYMPELILRGY